MITVFRQWLRFLFLHLKILTLRRRYKRYFIPTKELKDYNVITDGNIFLDQPIKNNLTAYENSSKDSYLSRDDQIIDCLPDYNHFTNYCNTVAMGFKQTTSTWYWCKSNAVNQFYYKSTLRNTNNLDFSQGTVKTFFLFKYIINKNATI